MNNFRALSCKSISVKHWVISLLLAVLVIFTLSGGINKAYAAIDVYEFDNPAQEAQYRALIEEFRCPKCQNQNLAGSDSQISQDLKRKTYEMVIAGQSDQQIRDYMYERYGDFITYKPPVRPSTWILWFFPPLFLLVLIVWWVWRSAKLNKKADSSKAGISASTEADKKTDEHSDDHTVESVTAKSGLSDDEQQALNQLLTKYSSKKTDGQG